MTERKAAIAPIPADVCRRICTGQVVTTLGDACKEVIDNALDAGATTIGEFYHHLFSCATRETNIYEF